MERRASWSRVDQAYNTRHRAAAAFRTNDLKLWGIQEAQTIPHL